MLHKVLIILLIVVKFDSCKFKPTSENFQNQDLIDKSFEGKIEDSEFQNLDKNKKNIIISTIAGNPPHSQHEINLYYAYNFLKSKNIVIDKILLMPETKKYVDYKSKQQKRPAISEEDRMYLCKELKKKLQKNKIISEKFASNFIISDYVIKKNENSGKNSSIDYPEIYELYEKENSDFNIIFVSGAEYQLRDSSKIHFFITIKKDEMSSSAIMDKNDVNHKKAIEELDKKAPGYLDILKITLKKYNFTL